MASFKKTSAARRTRRINPARDDREAEAPMMMPDFLVRRLGLDRLKLVTNRTVLQHWHD